MIGARDSRRFKGVFACDLRDQQFEEMPDGSLTAAVEVMRDGAWEHPFYGRIEIDAELRSAFTHSFFARARGIPELPIDYDHEPGPAAGWITNLRLTDNSVLADCRWTPEGRRKVREEEYRYFSPEWSKDYTDPSGRNWGPVLFGGGLTNSPFFRELAAVQASEPQPPAASGPDQEDGAMPDRALDAAPPQGVEPPGERQAADPQILGRLAALEAENARLKAAETRRTLEQRFGEIKIGRRSIAPASRAALVEVAVKCSQEVRDELAKAMAGLQLVDFGVIGFDDPATATFAIPADVEEQLARQSKDSGIAVEELRQAYKDVTQRRMADAAGHVTGIGR